MNLLEYEYEAYKGRKRDPYKAAYRLALAVWLLMMAVVAVVALKGVGEPEEAVAVQDKPEEEIVVEVIAPPVYEPAPVVEPAPDPLAKYHKIINCQITHYCCEKRKHICGTGDGITATGTEVKPYYTCAVDPVVIPYGAKVLVDFGDGELHEYKAEDCGGSVNGAHVDLAVPTHSEALLLGVKTATVYWIEEE